MLTAQKLEAINVFRKEKPCVCQRQGGEEGLTGVKRRHTDQEREVSWEPQKRRSADPEDGGAIAQLEQVPEKMGVERENQKWQATSVFYSFLR